MLKYLTTIVRCAIIILTNEQLFNYSHIIYRKDGLNMKKSYNIEVDCANCANKMEQAANDTEGVKSAVVNFMALKMNVEFEEGADEKKVMKAVLKNCRKVEDDCEIDF